MDQIISKHIDEVTQKEIEKANELTDLTWPETKPKNTTKGGRIQAFIDRCPNKTCHFMIDQGQIVGYAESFPRTIKTSTTSVTILGLGAVCVHPDSKGKGFGALLAKAAFNRVDEREFPAVLFQTAVPKFYKKLNCRLIKNKVVNSLSKQPEKNPFWDPFIMIYPKEFIGFEGEIDLLGTGY